MRLRLTLLACIAVSGGCDGTMTTSFDAGPMPDAAARDDARAPALDGDVLRDDASTLEPDASSPDAGVAIACRADDDGRFGAPATTFEIPASAIRDGGLYVRDVQAQFSSVDWSTLDRLYVPAGTYTLVYLGNLPQRSADRPLVITNRGGQVHVSATRNALSMRGGSNWILTGRYDPISMTGDAAFPGHRGCDYGRARGRYGFHFDSNFADGASVVGVGSPGGTEPGAGTNIASDFELEFLEIERAGFAGLMIKSDSQGDAHMENVRVHDLYIHDTISEGCYIGSTQAVPQHRIEIEFHHNRLLRAGTECGQFGQLARGSDIHHNVFGLCAIDWRDSFQQFQDSGVQLGVRQGDASFHHNIVIGASGQLLSLFGQPRDADDHAVGDEVRLFDNHLESTRGSVMWLHADSDAITAWSFERFTFRDMVFARDEVYADATMNDWIFHTSNSRTPLTFADYVWDGATVPVSEFTPSSQPTITVEPSVRAGVVAPIVFRDFMDLPADAGWLDIELWTDVAGRAPGSPAVTYTPGDFVMHDLVLYECLRSSTGEVPPEHAGAWRRVGVPVDDVRAVDGSPHSEVGLGGG